MLNIFKVLGNELTIVQEMRFFFSEIVNFQTFSHFFKKLKCSETIYCRRNNEDTALESTLLFEIPHTVKFVVLEVRDNQPNNVSAVTLRVTEILLQSADNRSNTLLKKLKRDFETF